MSKTKSNHPFFEGLDEQHIKALEKASYKATFRKGERLFHQGEPDDRIYLIHQGRVAIQAFAPGRDGRTIDTAGPGEHVGWSWLVSPFKAHYDALAEEDVDATAIDASTLRKLCDEDHELGYRVISRMVRLMEKRLQGTRLLLLDLYGTSQ